MKFTFEKFKQLSNEIHNNKYSYTKYFGMNIKTTIICSSHGKFLQTPSKHIHRKQGCPKCKGEKLSKHFKLDEKEFINRSNKIHKNKYDYSKVNYINTHTKIIIICSSHGEFTQLPTNHLYKKRGCGKCKGGILISQKEFIEKANKIHKNKYDYSKVNYINSQTKIIISCSKHGEFKQGAQCHLSGSGCKKCVYEKLNKKMKMSIKTFISRANKIHKNKYDYSKANYINNSTKIIIFCPQHGKFKQAPYSHLSGSGCPKCSHCISKGEIKWLRQLEKIQNIKIERNSTIYINGQQFKPDGLHKTTNTWYEYNGYFFHGHPDKYNPNNINKVNGKSFGDLYQATLEKEKIIKSAGYNLVVKWGD